MKSILITSFLLLATQQVLADTMLCCGGGVSGPAGLRANWCESGGGHVLCCYKYVYHPGKGCIEGFEARRLEVSGRGITHTDANQCSQNTPHGQEWGYKSCAKDGSGW
ncbi:hypothetical protein Ptr902_10256 [Pyrenophora tritici-repentis]|nr:hypothetical protein Ptr902_10256 [Pyrenophora tritici-repentis]